MHFNLLDDGKPADPYGIPVRLVKISKNMIYSLPTVFIKYIKKGLS